MSKSIAVLVVSALVAPGVHAAAADKAGNPLPPVAFSLPASVDVVSGVDLKRLFHSPLYAQLKAGDLSSLGSAVPPEKAAKMKKEIVEGIEKAMTEAEANSGIRPDRDLDQIVFAVSNTSIVQAPGGGEPDLVVLALGRFDQAAVERAYETAVKKEGGTPATRTVAGVTVHRMNDTKGKESGGFTFLDPGTLAFGTPAALDAFLGNRAKNLKPLQGNADLAARLGRLRPTATYWLVGMPSLAAGMAKGKTPPPMPLPQAFSLTLDDTAGFELLGEMATEAEAKNMADTIQGGLAMVKMQATSPEAQKQAPGADKLLDKVVVKPEGKLVRLAIPGSSGTAMIGALAAIAVPSLLSARSSANESAALGDVRTIISAEVAYASTNGGAYGSLTCLSQPATCLKGYKGEAFLSGDTLSALQPKNGYKRAFHPGKPGAKANSYRGFAYTATPAEPGKSGTRSFCGDDTGVVCADGTGAEIVPVGGHCPKTCKPVQ